MSPENKPECFPGEDERKRYYLTAYNACILFHAVSAYPDKHGLWSKLGLFKNKGIVLGGRKLTLNDLEHSINNGVKGCAPQRALSVRSARLWENWFPQTDTEKFNVLNLGFSLALAAVGFRSQPQPALPQAPQ